MYTSSETDGIGARGYRAFSCPDERANEHLFEAIAIARACAAAEMLIAERRADLARDSEGLIEAIERWARGPTSFDIAWDFAFGRAQRALESREVAPLDAALRIGLRAGIAGQAVAFRARASGVMGLRWDGHLLPAAEEVTVESDGNTARIVLCEGSTFRRTLQFERQECNMWRSEDIQPVPRVGRRSRIDLLSAGALPGDIVGEAANSEQRLVAQIQPGMVTAFRGGLRILEQHAPAYLGWVERVLRGILVYQYESARTRSGSFSDTPGLIAAAASPDDLTMAEMLVHEATHQYYHLLQYVGPIDDGTDERMYWSPPQRTHRPLARILIAYHAFGNIALFYRACARSGADGSGRTARSQAELWANIEALEAPLRDNPALNMRGRGLFEPLRERLHSRDAGG